MFEPGGILYVYFIYGMHWCANIVTDVQGQGAAVLLRGGVTPTGKHIDGPAKLASYLGLSGDDNARRVNTPGLRVRSDDRTGEYQATIRITPRIGITKAVDRPLRFVAASLLDDAPAA